ncbi:MAG TPA: MCE family protein, partial [Chromatiaceae bacterium]|nr:MCE family protein [Chromatiaceae bacterium]
MQDLPEAILAEERRGFSPIWLVPLVAMIIALVMVYRSYMEQGTEITIQFANAAGITAGKTRIKYRDVVIGMVKDVSFTRDFSQVLISADIDRDAEALLGEETRFWIVRPRIGFTGASGIDTLVTGVYIAMDPGKKSAK